jgi:predicted lipoprotein
VNNCSVLLNPCEVILLFKSLLLSAALLLPTLASAADGLQQANLKLVDEHLLPRSQKLAEASAALQQQAGKFCQAPDEAGLTAMRTQFHHTMDAWQGIQHLRFGPVELFLRYNRYQMWPDKHNTGSKQLRKVLSDQDPALLAADKFRRTSVALQGLTTLERLLFNDKPAAQFGTAQQPSYRCRLAEAIAANLSTMSSGIVSDWQSYRATIAGAEEGNDYYESSLEVTTRLLNNLHTQLVAIVDQKLLRPMGDGPDSAKPRRAESWRSRRSLKNITLNLQAVEEMYRIGFAPLLHERGADETDRQIRHAFSEVLKAATVIEQPLFAIVSDDAQRTPLEKLKASCSSLKRLIGEQLPQALDISLGFNSLDGD